MSRLFRLLGILGILFLLTASYFYYIWFQKLCVSLPEEEKVEIYISTGSSMQDFYKLLREGGYVLNLDDFELYTVIRRIKSVKPGRYILRSKMTVNELANMFSAGHQTAIKLVITPSRLPEDLAGKLAKQLEIDSLSIIEALHSTALANEYGFSELNFYTLFIPDTYEIYWNTSVDGLFSRMKDEYNAFWNSDRLAKSEDLNLSKEEATVLASIVYAEQNRYADERSRIAGLYLNRLRIGMLLQSDPTLIYGLGDFKRNRVLNKDKEIDSPYNTYKYAGLPPGPIYSPNKQAIDAVLNPENNKYLYMCAKDDFSGYHAFATNLREHNNNARRYQRALNKAQIYR